jgi:hypothetical protein
MLAQGKITIDRKVIQAWAQARQGSPALVRQRGEQALAIIFPDIEPGMIEKELSWKEFFEQFDQQKLVFMYQDSESSAELSRYFVFI